MTCLLCFAVRDAIGVIILLVIKVATKSFMLTATHCVNVASLCTGNELTTLISLHGH